MKKALAILLSTVTCLPAMAAEEINIYSFRQPFLIQPILDDFTKQAII